MKNRKLQSLAAYACGLLLTLIMTSIFVSCSDDDGDDDGGGAALTITSLNPATARVGETVTITGTGFSATPSQNTVMFKTSLTADAPAMVQEATATALKVVVPVNAVTGTITVTVAGKSITSPQPFTIDESLGAPVLTSLNPTSGFVNAEITITGSSFGDDKDAIDVFFGTAEATDVVTVTATTITVKVPASVAAGELDVKVVRDGVTSSNTLRFTVNATPVSVKTVYWVDNNKVYRGEIGDNGIEVTKLYDQDGLAVQGIAIDTEGSYIYWGRVNGVSRAPIDGSGPIEEVYTDAQKLNSVTDIAVDHTGGSIYFTSVDANGEHSYINKGTLTGEAPFVTLLDQASDAIGFNIKLALADGKLYWAEPVTQRVYSASLTGDFSPTVLFSAVSNNLLKAPVGVAVDNVSNKIFITDNGELLGVGESSILTGNLDGTGSLTTLVSAGSNVRTPYDAEIDTENGYFFWLNSVSAGGAGSEIMRVKLDGTNVEKLFDGFENGINFDIDIR